MEYLHPLTINRMGKTKGGKESIEGDSSKITETLNEKKIEKIEEDSKSSKKHLEDDSCSLQ